MESAAYNDRVTAAKCQPCSRTTLSTMFPTVHVTGKATAWAAQGRIIRCAARNGSNDIASEVGALLPAIAPVEDPAGPVQLVVRTKREPAEADTSRIQSADAYAI